jgi:hypothetical protein
MSHEHNVTIRRSEDINAKRGDLINFIWGKSGFPVHKLPSSITRNVESPVQFLENLQRVDEIHVAMDENEKHVAEQGLGYHFIAQRTNHNLVVVHHGHDCYLDGSWDPLSDTGPGYGLQRTINGLLVDGYSVLAVFMPRNQPATPDYPPNCLKSDEHHIMFEIQLLSGSPMKFFLEPVVVCLNYLQLKSSEDKFPAYEEFNMVGISGGGWTTTVYSAIDPRIAFSFPVAGSTPLYPIHEYPNDGHGDDEQNWPDFYKIAGYLDLYVMGSYGRGRKQVQILNRRDATFGPADGTAWVDAIRSYESEVRQTLDQLGSGGSFRLEIDDAPHAYEIYDNQYKAALRVLNKYAVDAGRGGNADFLRDLEKYTTAP